MKAVPTRIGKFTIEKVLGQGAMGVVYQGFDPHIQRRVAIKTVRKELRGDGGDAPDSIAARFRNEAQAVGRIHHPGVVAIYDFGEDEEQAYIAMEFVAGRPLADVVQEGPMAPDRVVKIMRQVCGALDEAHMQGVIHRDLKPENIVLTNRAGETDFVKVLDFGIAARTESADAQKEAKLTQQGMVLGTPPYMSPEQFTGQALDARSDIYSLAVMAYEMLTGKLPFEADTPWQWATQHMTAQPIPFEVAAPAKNIPEKMRAAILKGLSKDRDKRQASAREFFTDLSDGGRMTVEANPAETAANARTGTAAMDAVPAFTAAPAQAAPYGASPHPAPTPMAVAAAPLPPAPARTTGGGGAGGGKGLIFGLAGVGGVLLIAIVILVVRGNKPANTDLPPIAINTAPTTQAQGTQPIKPLDPVPADTTPVPAETAPSGTAGGSSAPAGDTSKPVAGTGKPSTPATPAPPKGDPCDACLAAAASGNATGVTASLSRCTDAGKQAACKSALQRTAIGSVKQAALNGNCARAKALAAAAESAGVRGAANGLKGTSCQ